MTTLVGLITERPLWRARLEARVPMEAARPTGQLVGVPTILACGLAAWAYGVSEVTSANIRPWGLLVGTNAWLPAGIAMIVVAFLLELGSRRPRSHLLWLTLVALIVAIHASVPIIFGAPQYAWVFKHVGIIRTFQQYGHVTDPTNIYQEWLTFFAGVAMLCSLVHVNALTFAQWAPLAFELANAVLVMALARLFTAERRVTWLALLLYEGLVAWVGQDYLSPQAFAYLLWLGTIFVVLRWLRHARVMAPPPVVAGVLTFDQSPREPGPLRLRPRRPRRWAGRSRGFRMRHRRDAARPPTQRGLVARLRSWLTDGTPQVSSMTRRSRALAVVVVTVIFVAIVTAHQITPYIGLASLAGLAALDLIRPRWLVLLLIAITAGFLGIHYHLVASEYGGLFSGDPISNAAGPQQAPNASTYQVWDDRGALVVAAVMWLMSVGVLLRNVRRPGPVAIQGVLAFAPFAVLVGGNYGGEAIFRVFLFSAPWCALLISQQLLRLRPKIRALAVVLIPAAVLFASVQDLFGTAAATGFTPPEIAASEWLYGHISPGPPIILPNDDFPSDVAANAGGYWFVEMPPNAPSGAFWTTATFASWLDGIGQRTAYFVTSPSSATAAGFYGTPTNYQLIARDLRRGISDARPIYSHDGTTIYRLTAQRSSAKATNSRAASRAP